MASGRLFGNDVNPACEYCEYIVQLLSGGSLLCGKRGIVQPTDKCRSFLYDPLKRIPKPPVLPGQFKAADFSIDPLEEERSVDPVK